MTHVLAFRGPDNTDYYSNNKIELGHNRLTIIDISEKGDQPMSNEDETIWITYNGEVYNYKDIGKELRKKGHKFRSKTDTESIIHAYEEYGEDCVKGLNGMFAFGIYNKNKNLLFLARDRLGVKPIFYYYSKKNNIFLFASEIKAILEYTHLKSKMRKLDLKNYFDFNKNTGIKNVYQLKPGHTLTIKLKNGKIKVGKQKCYWSMNTNITEYDEKKIIKNLRIYLKNSVKERLISDVPLGLFFSGGIDSNLMAFFTSKYKRNLMAFTVGTKRNNEFKQSKDACKFLELRYKHLVLTEKNITHIIPKVIYHLEDYDPRNVELCILNYYLSKLARRYNVKTVLSGEGVDELFCGYRNFFKPYFKKEYTRKNLQKEIKKWILGLNSNHLKNKDRGTMANAVELRVPYLDNPTFFEYSMKIDPLLKVKDDVEKYIFRMIGKGKLSEKMIKRKKAYFHMESGVPYILNEYFGIKSNGSLKKRFKIYKDIFKRIFIKKENYHEISMKEYKHYGK